MHWLSLLFLVSSSYAAQPNAVKPISAPLRDLQYGDVNFLHTTDVHGWYGGHLLEPSFSADWGDYIDLSNHLRAKLESENRDLILIDTGDRIEGNGLYDAAKPKSKYLFDIVKQQHIDVICIGNHELYKTTSALDEYNITVPAYRDNYLASNLEIIDPIKGQYIPLAPRFKKFTTPKQGIRITAFGYIFNFDRNAPNTRIIKVEETVRSQWFQEAIQGNDTDLFLVIGHVNLTSPEYPAVFNAIRKVHPNKPIQFFGGHAHVRDYRKYDANAYALASGRYLETIGFQSIKGFDRRNPKNQSLTFFRRYIDNNLFSFYHHTGKRSTTFHSSYGRYVSNMIYQARTEMKLDEPYGCARKTLWMSRVPYGNDDNMFTWLEKHVFPDVVVNSSRSDKPRLVLTNTGAIRFDLFKGSFTRDSMYLICPFDSGFHYIKDVPYEQASKVLKILNSGDVIFNAQNSGLEAWRLLAPEFRDRSRPLRNPTIDTDPHQQQTLDPSQKLQPGYVTHDDAGDDGDDTIHKPVPYLPPPNCIQATVNPANSTLNQTSKVDVVFNQFMQPNVLAALQGLGLSYTFTDCENYLPGVAMTDLIAKWVREHWPKSCEA